MRNILVSLNKLPDKVFADGEMRREILKLMQKLKGRTAAIILMHYGIGFDKKFTLREMAGYFKRTPERIRQIEIQGHWRLMYEWKRLGYDSYSHWEALQDMALDIPPLKCKKDFLV